MFVERVLLLVVQHPARDEGAAAAHDVHDATLLAHVLDRGARDAAVERHEVGTVLRLRFDRLQNVIVRHLDDSAMLLDGAHGRLIERHRSDHDRRVLDDALAREVDVVPRREIHDGIRAAAHCLIELLELRLDLGERARGADVRVHLGPEPLAHTARHELFVVDIRADGDAASRHTLPDRLHRDAFFLRHALHRVRDLALAGQLHLRCHGKAS